MQNRPNSAVLATVVFPLPETVELRSYNAICGPAAPALPGSLLKMQALSPAFAPLNQNLHLTRSPGNSLASSPLRNTCLEDGRKERRKQERGATQWFSSTELRGSSRSQQKRPGGARSKTQNNQGGGAILRGALRFYYFSMLFVCSNINMSYRSICQRCKSR